MLNATRITREELTRITQTTVQITGSQPVVQHQGASRPQETYVQGGRQGVDAGLIPKSLQHEFAHETPGQTLTRMGGLFESPEQWAYANGFKLPQPQEEAPPVPTEVNLRAQCPEAGSPAPKASACPAPPAPAPCAPTAARPKRTKAQNDAEFARNWKTFHKDRSKLNKNEQAFIGAMKNPQASWNQAVARSQGQPAAVEQKPTAACQGPDSTQRAGKAALDQMLAGLDEQKQRDFKGMFNSEILQQANITKADMAAIHAWADEQALAKCGGNREHPGFSEAKEMFAAIGIGGRCAAGLADPGLCPGSEQHRALTQESQACTKFLQSQNQYLNFKAQASHPEVRTDLLRLAQATIG